MYFTYSYLNAIEGTDDVHSCVVILRLPAALLLLWLLGQLDKRAGDTLQLSHVLTSLANNTADLRRSNHYLHCQPHVIRARHKSFFSHLLEDEILSL